MSFTRPWLYIVDAFGVTALGGTAIGNVSPSPGLLDDTMRVTVLPLLGAGSDMVFRQIPSQVCSKLTGHALDRVRDRTEIGSLGSTVVVSPYSDYLLLSAYVPRDRF